MKINDIEQELKRYFEEEEGIKVHPEVIQIIAKVIYRLSEASNESYMKRHGFPIPDDYQDYYHVRGLYRDWVAGAEKV